MATEKRKRISKKNKSAWRKTDIQDVEDYLEEQRQEERIGTFADKKDEDLFHIDIIEAEPHKKKVTISEREKRKLNAKRPLRSIQIWENISKVQDPIKKRNIVKQKKSGRNIEKEVCNPTRPRHFQANKDRAKYYEKKEQELKKKASKIPDTNKDIWMEEDFRDKIPGLKDEKGWISKDLSLYIAKNVGKPVIKVHDSIRHKTIKSNRKFMAPPPGTSYNPSFEDHRELITKVVEKEEKIIKEKKHLKRVTTNMFKKVTPEERDEMRLKEMRSGLDNDDDDDNDEAAQNEGILPEEDNDYSTVNPPVKNKKKTKQARNKELKQRDLQQHVTGKKAIKKQIADINRLKSLKKEVLAEEEKLNELKKKRKKAAFLKKFETKRLGRLKFQEPDEDVKMPEDLVGNLRNVEPESSLLVDRFKSFQKRNIIPVSIATGKQKAPKIKRFPRSSHKEPGISYQILREKRLGKK